MIKPLIFKAKIEFNKIIAEETHRIRFVPELKNFTFEPGQFVTVTVAPMIRRSYSVASAPGGEHFDLIGDTKMGGPGSQFFASAKEGDVVDVLGPLGLFTYKESGRPAIFWATGTGIVPFISMTNFLLEKGNKEKIILNSSFKFEVDIFAKDEFEELAAKYENFDFNLYVSRPTEVWKGLSGRITEFFPKLEGEEAAKYDHYLCGTKVMIEDVVAKLESMDVAKEQMHYEKYY